MNWIPILTHGAAIGFGLILGLLYRNYVIRHMDEQLLLADTSIDQLYAELDATNTKLAAEKAENEHLVRDVAWLRRIIKRADQPRNHGKFASKLAKVA